MIPRIPTPITHIKEDQVKQRTTRAPIRVFAAVALAALMSTTLAVTASYADDEELIVNGGFEDGLTGWFVNNGNATDGGTLSLTSDAFSGANGVLTTGRQTTGSGPMQDLSGKLTAGGTYTITARIKYTNANSPATKQFFATMHYGGGTYTNLGCHAGPRRMGLHQLHVHDSRGPECRDDAPLPRDAVDSNSRGCTRHAPHGLHRR